MDPLEGSSWSHPDTVAGFVRSPPNEALLALAAAVRAGRTGLLALDIGCGAGRNALPLAEAGWNVVGLDLSWPMLAAARDRRGGPADRRARFALAPMEALPVASSAFDLVVAHGIWNLARSAAQFRLAVREAARAAREGAPLFVFTFSRHTLPDEAEPVPGEAFVFTRFSGEPQCFLTEAQLVGELRAGGFERDAAYPLRELNLPRPGQLEAGRAPVIWEGVFRATSC
jgi:SAM-dependent methyltransferase